MKVEPTTYPGWNDYPVYHVKSYDDYTEICSWMIENRVKYFLVNSGSMGYAFQVRNNHEWFKLRWT